MTRYHLTTVIEADSESAVRQSWIDGEIGAIAWIEEVEPGSLPFGLTRQDALVLLARIHAAFSMSESTYDAFDVIGQHFRAAGFRFPTEDEVEDDLRPLVDEDGCIELAHLQPWWPQPRNTPPASSDTGPSTTEGAT